MNTYNDQDFFSVMQIAHRYFEGLHYADTRILKEIFHPDCVLKAPDIRRDLNEWFALVESRPVPADDNYAFDYKIIGIQLLGDQAMLQVYCPLLGSHFTDYLGLLKEDDHWQIVNKMYADTPNMKKED